VTERHSSKTERLIKSAENKQIEDIPFPQFRNYLARNTCLRGRKCTRSSSRVSLSAGLHSLCGFIEVVLWYGLRKQTCWTWHEHLIKLASTEYEILVVGIRSLDRCLCFLYPIYLSWRNDTFHSTV